MKTKFYAILMLALGAGAMKMGAQNLVQICHKGHEIMVAPQAVQAHLDHGDWTGSCTGPVGTGTMTSGPAVVLASAQTNHIGRNEAMVKNVLGEVVYLGKQDATCRDEKMKAQPSGIYYLYENIGGELSVRQIFF